MLRDETFSSRAKVDRYGRKLPGNAGRKELERFYRIKDDDSEGAHGEREEDEDEKIERDLRRINTEDEDLSSSSDGSSSDDDELEEAAGDEVFGLLNENEGQDGIPKGEVSSRLAVVNLDWDNIRAADLMAVFSSFMPSSDRIVNVAVYPSEFGRERMDREELEGPPKEIFGQNEPRGPGDGLLSSSEEGDQEEEDERDGAEDERIKKSIVKEDQGLEFNSAKLRRYQLERLRYYYAVLTCSSISAAEMIYNAVDGTEYLTTANFFDLRYIPDETDFSNDKPRDECARIPNGYKPNEFVTDALQHSKVKLTWDADDRTRKEAQKRAFAGSRADIDENDLKAYLGSDSSEDEASGALVVDATSATSVVNGNDMDSKAPNTPKLSKKDAERQKMRALLGLQSEPVSSKKPRAEQNAPVGDMQVTFSSGLSEPNKGSVFENEPERDETTVEKYVRKEKERKARRKEKSKRKNEVDDATVGATADQAELIQASSEEIGPGDSATQDLGFQDPFFTAPSSDKVTTTAQRKAEKRQKRDRRAADEAASRAKRAELELLMIDDKTRAQEMNHFDINEIARAEKAAKKQQQQKKSSKKRLSEREKEALAMKERDAFEMNVGDERFTDVFRRSDFAIDPSHPRFKGTDGMKQLLEEGRRKRESGVVDDEGGERRRKKAKRKGMNEEEMMDDVQSLVKRLKSKTKD